MTNRNTKITVESGDFPLMRSVDVSRQPERMKVYTAWTKAFNYNVPDAVEHLADIIEDVYTFELWKDNYLDTPEQFLERIGILGLDLEEPAKLIKELRKKRSSKKAEIIKRAEEAKRLRDQGMTQREIAERLGVTDRTIRDDLKAAEKTVMTEISSASRQRITYQITNYTKPTTAAEKIRATFGDEWARELADSLLLGTEFTARPQQRSDEELSGNLFRAVRALENAVANICHYSGNNQEARSRLSAAIRDPWDALTVGVQESIGDGKAMRTKRQDIQPGMLPSEGRHGFVRSSIKIEVVQA